MDRLKMGYTSKNSYFDMFEWGKSSSSGASFHSVDLVPGRITSTRSLETNSNGLMAV